MKSTVLNGWAFTTTLLLLAVKLNRYECFPTTNAPESWTTLSNNDTTPNPTEPAPSVMEETELPQPQFDQEAGIAITEPEIPFVEDSTTTDVILLDDNNRDTEFSNSSSLSSSSEKELNNETHSIVHTTQAATLETETTSEDTNTGGEELDQPTNEDITRPTNDDIIEKNEIFNELNNIWYYTEELGEDQKDLKSSLSSLLDTTYERVHEQSGETLGKLKHLLRRLRSRLLRQPDSVEAEAAVETPFSTQTQQGYENHPNFSEVERETVISDAKSRQRRGTNLKERKITDEEASSLFDNANLDENSLASSEKSGSFSKRVNLTTFTDEDSNFVHVTIFHPNNNTQDQTDDKIAHPTPATMKETEIWDTKSSESTLKPNAKIGFKIPSYEFPDYKKKYQILKEKNKVKTTQFPEEKNMLSSRNDTDPSYSDLMPTIENVIESIIGVLNTPISSPVATISGDGAGDSANDVNWKPFDSLPDYLSKLTSSVGVPDLHFSNELNGTKFLELPDHSVKNSNSSEDLSGTSSSNEAVILTPTTVINGTVERLYLMANTLARMPSPARFVMLFSIAISVASIGLGVYSLGPPLIVVGVLGIIVPILLFLLVQNNAAKRKAGKEDILDKLKVEDFYQALDMIADAMIKYDNQ